MSAAVLGLWAVVVAAVLGGVGGAVGRRGLAMIGAVAAAVLSSLMLGRLATAFVSEDWSYEYVADHTRSGIGTLPRLAGLWAGPEGSLLLWATLTAWAMVIALALVHDRATIRVLSPIAGLLVGGYAAIVASVASPFETLAIPAVDGLGLQPILEHPAMVWHPPVLYAGLVGMLVPSTIAAARGWARRPIRVRAVWWSVPLGLLAAGLLSGARWAHAELGWGGFWAWDPIESAGLAAWLAAVAALHLGRGPVSNRRVMLAVGVLPGLAAIWATTLTRVGLVSSVHAFADRPALRSTLLVLAALGSAALLGSVAAAGSHDDRRVSSRRSGAQLGAWVLLVAALYVSTGTYEPLVEAATTGDRVAIAGTFFARLMWPVAIVGCAFAVRADRRWLPAVLGAAVGTVAVPMAVGPFGLILAAAGGAVAGSAASFSRPGRLAHVGSGLMLIGIAGSLATSVTAVRLEVDTPTIVDGMTLTHRSIEITEGDVVSTAVAQVEVDGSPLLPSLDTYHLRGVSTAEVAHRSLGLDEIQIVLLNADRDQARYRVNRFPRMHLVWLGGVVLIAGLLGQSLRRFRASSWLTVDPSDPSSSDESGTTGGAVGGAVGGEDAMTTGGDTG